MTDPRPPATDALDAALRDLRGRVVFPPTPDLAGPVGARIASGRPAPRRRFALVADHPFRWAAAALLLLAALTLVASSSVRHAAADALGVAGIRIERVRDEPTPLPSPAGATIGLGARTTLAASASGAGFALAVPDPAVYGAPDDVYLRPLSTGGTMVTLVYAPDDRFPEAAETGVGALLMQFPTVDDEAMLIKRVMGDGRVQGVAFDGANGFWVTGTSELVILDDPAGPVCCARQSANVLIWQRDGITYRLESALTLDEAMAVARSMAPFAAGREP